VSVLVTICTLLAASYAQTSNTRTGPETIDSQDVNPMPSNPGERIAPGAVHNSANNPGQGAPGDRPVLPPQLGIPANPAAADLNSSLLSAPLQAQAEVPRNAFFEFLFNNVSALNQIAESDDKAGQHASAMAWRTHDQRAAGLNDSEGQILQEIALDCLRALKEQDAKLQASADKFRAQLTPGAPVQIPPELVKIFEDRKAIVNDHVERLRGALGDTSFNKLDSYVHSSFHAEVIVPKPASPSVTTTEKKQKDNK